MSEWSADIVVGHATAATPDEALASVLAQFGVAGGAPFTSARLHRDGRHAERLGIVYLTDGWAPRLTEIVRQLRERTQVRTWVGAAGLGVCANGTEYMDQPAIVAMIARLPARSFQPFRNLQVLARLAVSNDDEDARNMSPESLATPRTSGLLLHADGQTLDYAVQVADARNLAGSDQTFGVAVERGDNWATQYADAPVPHGLSGVRFLEPMRLFSRISQGLVPLGGEHIVTHCTAQRVVSLDGRPALDVLLADLNLPPLPEDANSQTVMQALQPTAARRGAYLGIAPPDHRNDARFDDTFLARRLRGVDTRQRTLEADPAPPVGAHVVFCARDPASARASLVRACTELREQIESEGRMIRAAFYHGCAMRNRNVFSGGLQTSVELALIRRHLGAVPLIGLYAGSQISGGYVHRYSGVLTALA
ncbi:MAG: FIST C-terminal domain-containing protein [Burkholderiaceae bacterium]